MKSAAFWCSLPLVLLSAATAPGQTPRIVGGAAAPAGAYPWMTALVSKAEPNDLLAQECAGSLIHPYWVLTAAHCVEGLKASDIQVIAGATDLSAGGLTRVNVLETIQHPDYTSNSDDHDIALLLLETPVTGVAPVEVIDDPALTAPGVLSTVMGWGTVSEVDETGTPVLLHAQVPIMDSAIANQPDFLDGGVTPNMLAAGLEEGGVDTCFGDSGGPLVIRGRQNQWVQAGIISWGEGCAQPKKPGVYTRVSRYRRWIQSYVWPDFEAWETAAGLDPDDGPDVDGDGATQWMEYALRRDPLNPFDASGFPVAGLFTSPGHSYATLTLRRPAGGGNVHWGLQASPDLTTWTSLNPPDQLVGSPAAVPGDSGAEQITWRGTDGTPASFLRAVIQPGRDYYNTRRTLVFPNGVTQQLHSLDTLTGGFRVREYLLSGLPEGDSVTVVLRSAAFDSVLRLINAATGAVLATSNANTGGGNDEKLTFTPAAGISYAVQVTTQTAGSTGEFSLGAYSIPTGTPTISGSQTQSGTLDTEDPVDPFFPEATYYYEDYVFTPATAAAVTITLSSAAFDASFTVVNVETNSIVLSGFGIQSQGAALNSFVPVPGTTYLIRASSNLPDATGAYTVRTAATTTLAPGGSRTGSLSSTDGLDPYYAPDDGYYADDFVLTGATAGVSRTITVSSDFIDSTLELIDAQTGESLDYNDDETDALGDSIITFTPLAGRSYLLRVSSYDPLETGSYTISAN